MCEKPKIPKIHDYNREKMGIVQNEVVWKQNTGGGFLLCSEFHYHSENTRHSENSNFRYAQ